MTSTARPDRRERPERPIEREEVVRLAVVAVLGALWGVAWQRSAALSDIAAIAPVMLLVIGPGLLVVYLGLRLATGSFEMRITGWGAALAAVAALLGNLLTPGLSPSVAVAGTVTGTLDGAAVDGTGTCVWGPGRTAVIRVTGPLAKGSGTAMFTTNIPGGTMVMELPAGSIVITDISAQNVPASMPLRAGSGDVGTGDRATGTVTLHAGQGAIADGELAWTCQGPPAT